MTAAIAANDSAMIGSVTEATQPDGEVVNGMYPVALNQSQVDREDQHEVEGDEEARDREADHGDELHEAVDPAAAAGGEDAEHAPR